MVSTTITKTETEQELAVRTLRRALFSAVEENMAEAILLSGGLDTSIVSAIASKLAPVRAYTVALEGAPSPDVEYARLVAKNLRLTHRVYVFRLQELLEALPEVVRVLKVFDPMEIRNSVAIFIGLKQAKADGCTTVLTGDGCNELFAGYSFLFKLDPPHLRMELEKLWRVMSFSSISLASSLGMEPSFHSWTPRSSSLPCSWTHHC